SEMIRAWVAVWPPAVKGTITLTGRCGQVWAWRKGVGNAEPSAMQIAIHLFIVVLPSHRSQTIPTRRHFSLCSSPNVVICLSLRNRLLPQPDLPHAGSAHSANDRFGWRANLPGNRSIAAPCRRPHQFTIGG